MKRSRNVLLAALTIAIGGCGGAGATSSASSGPTAASTPMAMLDFTTEKASAAPAGAIVVKMALPDGQPRFQPDTITAKAGTVVLFLQNVPGAFSPKHQMTIGSADVQFYADGSVSSGQVLAGTPAISANETMTFTVNKLPPGTYRVWCSVNLPDGGNHASGGMVGTLTVTP